MANRQKLLHIRSNVVEKGGPKMPSPNVLSYGEIAINYSAGNEKLFIKNEANQIIPFLAEDAILSTEEVMTSQIAGNKKNIDLILSKLSFYEGVNKVSSVANIPVTKRLVEIDIKAAQSFSLASIPEAGKEIHIMVKNSGASNAVVSIPTNNPYMVFGENALTIKPNETKEINALSNGKIVYIRTA